MQIYQNIYIYIKIYVNISECHGNGITQLCLEYLGAFAGWGCTGAGWGTDTFQWIWIVSHVLVLAKSSSNASELYVIGCSSLKPVISRMDCADGARLPVHHFSPCFTMFHHVSPCFTHLLRNGRSRSANRKAQRLRLFAFLTELLRIAHGSETNSGTTSFKCAEYTKGTGNPGVSPKIIGNGKELSTFSPKQRSKPTDVFTGYPIPCLAILTLSRNLFLQYL